MRRITPQTQIARSVGGPPIKRVPLEDFGTTLHRVEQLQLDTLTQLSEANLQIATLQADLLAHGEEPLWQNMLQEFARSASAVAASVLITLWISGGLKKKKM